MANELHTMPLKVEKFFSSATVRGMTWDEQGAYLLLLAEAWLKGGLIPASRVAQARLLRISEQGIFDRIHTNVISVCFIDFGDGEHLFNEHLAEIYNEVFERSKRLSEAGRRGGSRQAQARLKGGSSMAMYQSQSQNQMQNQSVSSSVSNNETTEHNTNICSDLEASKSKPPTKTDIFLVLDPIGFDGVEESDMASWAAAYPAVELGREAVKAAIWCRDNGARGKKKNYRRFLSNWFARAQEKGGTK